MQKADMESFAKELKKADLKLTYPRQRIFQVFNKANKPLSIQEITSKILDIHYSTVYRNIEALTDAKIINKIPHGFKYRYEFSDKFTPHHHHAICKKCNTSFKINSQQIEYMLDEAALLAGVKPTSHYVEVIGICKKCDQSI